MSGALRIQHFRAGCRVAHGTGSTDDMRDRMTRALGRHFVDAARGTLTLWFDGDDESLWMIRRLDLQVSIDASAPADALATALARSVASALSKTLVGDGDGVDVIRFRSPAALLARFVLDAADDAGRDRWYYAPFDGLRLVPASAAIRTALTEDPPRGLSALALLTDNELARVVSRLTRAHEQQVLHAFGAGVDEAQARRRKEQTEQTFTPPGARTLHEVPSALDRAVDHDSSPANDVSAFDEIPDEIISKAQDVYTRAIASGLDAGLALFAFVHAGDAASFPFLMRAIRVLEQGHHRESRVARLAAASSRPAAPTTSTSPHSHRPDGDWAAATSADDPILTRFGGAFLLLRDLEELPLERWTSDWPSLSDVPASCALGWLVLAACSGRARVKAALGDSALRALFGVSPDLAAAEISAWLRQTGTRCREQLISDLTQFHRDTPAPTPEDVAWLTHPPGTGMTRWCHVVAQLAATVVRRFAQRLPGFSTASIEYVWHNFLSFDATVELDLERVVVRCGRPPLHLILTLTGMTRGLQSGHDAGGRSVQLFARE